MSNAALIDRQTLEIAFSEVDGIRNVMPEAALSHLAREVVRRVADNLMGFVAPALEPSSQQIDSLCHALLSSDPRTAIALIEKVQREGASYDDLCLSYLAVAARRLGDWWDDDKVPFYAVTLAAGRIYAILRTLRLKRHAPLSDMRHAAIFASVPGEDHTLGITMAADLARDRGWDIELFTGLPHEHLLLELEQRPTPLIGLSASARRSLPALIRLIVAIRISKPWARILVCGQIAALNFNLVGLTGADAATADFEVALAHMGRLATAVPQHRLM